MSGYEYALIIGIVISTMGIINLFLIIKIKEKHILEMQNIDFKHLRKIIDIQENHYHNMGNMHKKIIKITNERIDEIIEYIISENKE